MLSRSISCDHSRHGGPAFVPCLAIGKYFHKEKGLASSGGGEDASPSNNGFREERPLRFGIRQTLGGASPDTSQCCLYGTGIGSVNGYAPMARNPLFKDRRIRMKLGI
jgi:hypothetical protein